MTPQERQQFNQMKLQVKELLEWKKQRIAQQITNPLDTQSQTILNKYFLTATSNLWDNAETGETFKRLVVTQDGITNVLYVFTSLIRYTANASANTLLLGPDIINRKQGTLADGDVVYILAGEGTIQTTPSTNTATPPSPLFVGAAYYVVNPSGNTVQLSATPGGAAINLTTTGTGQQFIYSTIP